MSALRAVKRRARSIRARLGRRNDAPSERSIIDAFHRLSYEVGKDGHGATTWRDARWFGFKVFKTPLDLWIYQEIIFETRPDLIIETGTAAGGSALFFATLFDVMGTGEVVSVDIDAGIGRATHERVRFLHGSSVDPEILSRLGEIVRDRERVMVVLDSDHSRDHVLQELEAYSPFVTKDCYLIVEDTNINGHPVYASFGPGPAEAVHEFLEQHSEFEQDPGREKFLMTFNPGGYLKRK